MIRIVLTVSILASTLACTKPDLSTDEGVLRALNAARVSGNPYEADDICVNRPEQLPGFVLVGHFAHDRGCMPGEVFIAGKEPDRSCDRHLPSEASFMGSGVEFRELDQESREEGIP